MVYTTVYDSLCPHLSQIEALLSRRLHRLGRLCLSVAENVIRYSFLFNCRYFKRFTLKIQINKNY